MKPGNTQTKTPAKTDWYEAFIEDCKDILVEHGFASRWALIEGYHAFGARIIEEMPALLKVHKSVDKVTATVAVTLGK